MSGESFSVLFPLSKLCSFFISFAALPCVLFSLTVSSSPFTFPRSRVKDEIARIVTKFSLSPHFSLNSRILLLSPCPHRIRCTVVSLYGTSAKNFLQPMKHIHLSVRTSHARHYS